MCMRLLALAKITLFAKKKRNRSNDKDTLNKHDVNTGVITEVTPGEEERRYIITHMKFTVIGVYTMFLTYKIKCVLTVKTFKISDG